MSKRPLLVALFEELEIECLKSDSKIPSKRKLRLIKLLAMFSRSLKSFKRRHSSLNKEDLALYVTTIDLIKAKVNASAGNMDLSDTL